MSTQIDEKKLQKHFDKHKKQFDGTEVRASQIYLKLPQKPSKSDLENARNRLNDFKTQIEQNKLTFAEAARKWSQSTSAEKGGDIGFFQYEGKMPLALSAPAFELEAGEIGEPFQSPFGMHLMTVTEIRPGQFVLEDVRTQVRGKIETEEWNKLVPVLKKSANIEYVK